MPTRTFAMLSIAGGPGSENPANWWIPSLVCLGLMFLLLRGGIRSYRRGVARDYACYLRSNHPEYEVLGADAGSLRLRRVNDGHERVVHPQELGLIVARVRGVGPDADRRRHEVYASFTGRTFTGGETWSPPSA